MPIQTSRENTSAVRTTMELLSPTDARALTDEVKADASALWTKMLGLYEGGAHTTLGYKSWAAYCEAEFEMSDARAYRILQAARVIAQLPIGSSIPATESQARPLSRLPAEEQGEAWAEVQKRAEQSKQPVTAATVQAVVEERLPKTIKDLLPVGSFVLTRYSPEPYVIAAHEVYGDHTTLRSNMFWEFKERFGEAPNTKNAGWLNGCRIEDGKVMSGNEELQPISRENAEWLYKEARVTGRYWSPDQVKGYNRLVLSLGKPEWIKKEEEPAAPKAKTSKRQPEVEIISPVSQVPLALPEPPQTTVIDVPPAQPESAKPEPARSPADWIEIREMHNALLDALEGENPVSAYPNETLRYWVQKIRELRERVRELESTQSAIRSYGRPYGRNPQSAITPGLRLRSRKVPDWTYRVKNQESDGAWVLSTDDGGAMFKITEGDIAALYEPYEAPINPFSDGKHAQYIDAASRLDRVKHFDLPQLRAALDVPGLQGTVRFAIERRIKKLEKGSHE